MEHELKLSKKEILAKMILRPLLALSAFALLKYIRWVLQHEPSIHQISETLIHQGLANQAVQNFAMVVILFIFSGLVCILFSKKQAFHRSKLFWSLYFFLLDAIFMYCFPELMISLLVGHS